MFVLRGERSLCRSASLFGRLRGNDIWVLVVIAVILRLRDLDRVGHNLVFAALDLDFGTLHDLYLESKNTLTQLDVSHCNVDEIVLGLTRRYLVTLSVLLGLGTLATYLTGNNNLTTGGVSATHDGTEDVVGGHTDWGACEELVLESLAVGSGAEVTIVLQSPDGEVDLVVAVVEVVSLANERLDLLHLTSLLGGDVVGLGGTDADLRIDGGGADLDASIALHTESLLEELVELSLENTIGNELLLRVDLLHALGISHRVLVSKKNISE